MADTPATTAHGRRVSVAAGERLPSYRSGIVSTKLWPGPIGPAAYAGLTSDSGFQPAARTKIERALAAVPVAGEDHRLCFHDVERSVAIQGSGDVERIPGQLPLCQERDGAE